LESSSRRLGRGKSAEADIAKSAGAHRLYSPLPKVDGNLSHSSLGHFLLECYCSLRSAPLLSPLTSKGYGGRRLRWPPERAKEQKDRGKKRGKRLARDYPWTIPCRVSYLFPSSLGRKSLGQYVDRPPRLCALFSHKYIHRAGNVTTASTNVAAKRFFLLFCSLFFTPDRGRVALPREE